MIRKTCRCGAISLPGSSECAEHQRQRDKTKNARNVATGRNTAAWKQLRQRALTRDGNRCQLRLPGCTGTATSVHLRSTLHGDHRKATLDDCKSACAACHAKLRKPGV